MAPLIDGQALPLKGLRMLPSQVIGAFRLVPLVRESVVGDLRLTRRAYGSEPIAVALGGKRPMTDPGHVYTCTYAPHALVLDWDAGEEPLVRFGTELQSRRQDPVRHGVRMAHRIVKREEPRRLRMLPLAIAFEGYLIHHFGGPDIAWREYSDQLLRDGLSPRRESFLTGRALVGFEDALRVFEVCAGQVGVLVFVADALASVFVTPHPDDYRSLHRTLLTDYFGELMWRYALQYPTPQPQWSELHTAAVDSFDDLRAALRTVHSDWAAWHESMSSAVFDAPLRWETLTTKRRFTLQRFMSSLDPALENHIGEVIVGSDGTLEYAKTYRLSGAQTRRAYLLSQLAAHEWDLAETASALQTTMSGLCRRLDNAGFGSFLAPHIRQRLG